MLIFSYHIYTLFTQTEAFHHLCVFAILVELCKHVIKATKSQTVASAQESKCTKENLWLWSPVCIYTHLVVQRETIDGTVLNIMLKQCAVTHIDAGQHIDSILYIALPETSQMHWFLGKNKTILTASESWKIAFTQDTCMRLRPKMERFRCCCCCFVICFHVSLFFLAREKQRTLPL